MKRWTKTEADLGQISVRRTEFISVWRALIELSGSPDTRLIIKTRTGELTFGSVDEFENFVTLDAISNFTLVCGVADHRITVATDRWFNPRASVRSTDKGWARVTLQCVKLLFTPYRRSANAVLSYVYIAVAVTFVSRAVTSEIDGTAVSRAELGFVAFVWVVLLGMFQATLRDVLAGARLTPDSGWSPFNSSYFGEVFRAATACAIVFVLYRIVVA